MSTPRKREDSSEDTPPYSRLFIVCDKRYQESDFQEPFSVFGTIEDIRVPRSYNTGEPRGVAYIKYAKTSSAALALEEMNKKCLKDGGRPLKVMVAANRSDIHDKSGHEEHRFNRLFITVPKTASENEICEVFGKYGYVESVLIQRDRNTGEPRGFAYVKFKKFSEAAIAFEEAPKEYRALFALPKQDRKSPTRTMFESSIHDLASPSHPSDKHQLELISMMNTYPAGFTRVNFMCCPRLTRMHVECLFDIVPGMVECQYFVDLLRNIGKGSVSYSSPISAAYAIKKLNEFEYPPGMKIYVKPYKSKFDNHQEQNFSRLPQVAQTLNQAVQAAASSATPDLAQLAEAIADASKLIKMATSGVTENHDSNDLNYCSVKLPPPQPLADIDSVVAKRCFLVCKPQPPPLTVLRDIFCRFGDLINVYTLPNKTVGYARYASTDAADEAMNVLHGAEVCGVRIKVLEAEDENPAKKRRYGRE